MKPIQICTAQDSATSPGYILTLCDDGSIWGYACGQWTRLESIPGQHLQDELALAYESMEYQVQDWKAEALRIRAERDEARALVKALVDDGSLLLSVEKYNRMKDAVKRWSGK